MFARTPYAFEVAGQGEGDLPHQGIENRGQSWLVEVGREVVQGDGVFRHSVSRRLGV